MKYDPKKYFDPSPNRRRFTPVFEWIQALPDLSLEAKMVYSVFANTTFGNGFSAVKNEFVCKKLGMSKSAVIRAIHELQDYSLVERHRSGNGGARCDTFFLHHPAMPVMDERGWSKVSDEIVTEEEELASVNLTPAKSDLIPSKCQVDTLQVSSRHLRNSHKSVNLQEVTAKNGPPIKSPISLSKDSLSQSSTAVTSEKESHVNHGTGAVPVMKRDGTERADSHERRFWNFWLETYEAELKMSCMEVYNGKVIKLVRSILDRQARLPDGKKELARMVKRYMQDTSEFVVNCAHSITAFAGNSTFPRYTDLAMKARKEQSNSTTANINHTRRLN